MKKVLYTFIILSAILGVLAGCGGDSGQAGFGSGDAVPSACGLLEEADVSAAANTSETITESGSDAEDGLFSSCFWQAEESGGNLGLNIWASGSASEGWATEFVKAQAQGGTEQGVDIQPVAGVGDEAYIFLEGNFGSLWWRKDNNYVIALSVIGLEISEEALIELAQKID
ncbi:MAG: hypothetical protein QNJ45_11505 [Ardenticatenaceae bacterium]|nr:hypothetical protein [Ardenticatenaceae bacterium]